MKKFLYPVFSVMLVPERGHMCNWFQTSQVWSIFGFYFNTNFKLKNKDYLHIILDPREAKWFIKETWTLEEQYAIEEKIWGSVI